MRCWHKDLIPVLPRQQLLSQWRECCCIARNLAENGTPNHILVNKVLTYSDEQFNTYTRLVYEEMKKRGYSCDWSKFEKWRGNKHYDLELELFRDWHNDRYYRQCYYNLEEKYDCGGLTTKEWEPINAMFIKLKREGRIC